MKTSTAIVSIAAAVFVLSTVQAKVYKINNSEFKSKVEWLRVRRQSHSDEGAEQSTSDHTINDVPAKEFASARQDLFPVPAEYLTPPAPERPRPRTPFPPLPLDNEQPPPVQGKWDLGYEAGDILVPPLPDDQGLEYDTLKSSVGQEEQPKEPVEENPMPNELDAAADSRIPFVENPQENLERQERSENPPSVYSFVKTNPHGHFKWGVHIGH